MTPDLSPCPFCGESLAVNNAKLAAHPRGSECLLAQNVIVVDDPKQVAKWQARLNVSPDTVQAQNLQACKHALRMKTNTWLHSGRKSATPSTPHSQLPTRSHAMNDLADRLEAFIPRGDGYNSDYANTLTEAVEALRAQSAPAEVAQGEVVAWFTEDCKVDKSATTYDRETAERWRLKGWPVTAMYTAPPSPDWREHSRHIAKGEQCPETTETLQAAWDRDQELINDMRHEIARHKTLINRLEQRRTPVPDAELIDRLRIARKVMAAVLAQERIKAVAKRVLADEIDRIDAKLPRCCT